MRVTMEGQRRKDTSTWSALGTLIILQLCFTVDLTNGQQLEEYCDTEAFNPECKPDEVVVIKSASYGRMRLGRCIKMNYGNLGCHSDVRQYLDSRCSGSRTCQLRIPLIDVNPCPANLKSYLEASYTCIRVESASCHMCQSMTHAVVTQDKGYLASVVSQESQTGCGTVGCPWRIEVPPGQRVNLTLFDFGAEVPISEVCLLHANIREKGSPQLRICHSNKRESHIHLSRTNIVEISIAITEVSGQRAKFMIYHEAVGCPGLGETETCDSTSSTAKLTELNISWPAHFVIEFFVYAVYKSYIV